MLISEYFTRVKKLIDESEIVVSEKISFTEFASDEGMIRGRLLLMNGYSFEFMEYVKGDTRLKYRFHLADADGNLVFRYDNAKHHPELENFPHHLHLRAKVVSSKEKSFPEAFKEVLKFILRLR